VALLGAGGAWAGRTRASIEEEVRLFGVGGNVSIIDAVPHEKVNSVLQSAKVSVIMSMHEGSSVVVAESLLADIPVALIAGARVGSGALINEETGCFLRPSSIAADLSRFVENYQNYRPRKWMLEHGKSYKESSIILNNFLKSWAREAGYPWTVDLVPMQWRPNPEYVTRDDALSMSDEYTRFEKAYNVGLHPPPVPPEESNEPPTPSVRNVSLTP
jgi:hypothetical protein